MTRPMTNAMAGFLDALDASDKRAIEAVALEGGTSLSARMMHAVFTEILAAQVREDEVLAALEADRRAEVDRLVAEADWTNEPPC